MMDFLRIMINYVKNVNFSVKNANLQKIIVQNVLILQEKILLNVVVKLAGLNQILMFVNNVIINV